MNSLLKDACAVWQGGMEGGSSPIRAAGRNLTGIKHYFMAAFITAYEEEARTNQRTTQRARILLEALATSPLRTAAEWGEALGVDLTWVGRGIKRGQQDSQILRSLSCDELTMPLWGASFDPEVARKYGDRFTFVIHDRFPAVPAWLHSGLVPDELELICGGRYAITEPIDTSAEHITVHLRFIGLPPLLDTARKPTLSAEERQ